jgi:hypothetical protein
VIFLSLIPGGIGFVLFVYASCRWCRAIAGLLLMAIPPTTGRVLTVVVVAICAGLWIAVRMGY